MDFNCRELLENVFIEAWQIARSWVDARVGDSGDHFAANKSKRDG